MLHAWGTKSVVLPPLEALSGAELASRLNVGDSVLVVTGGAWYNHTVTWGQYQMLKRFGYDQRTAEILSRYVHTFTITDPERLLGVEALPPEVHSFKIAADYSGIELLVLQPRAELTLADMAALLATVPHWLGRKYDRLEYLIYPFYMAYGWTPRWWATLWDDPRKPVCSTLNIRLLQAAGRLKDIPDPEAYPPARLALLEALRPNFRAILTPNAARADKRSKPWWMR